MRAAVVAAAAAAAIVMCAPASATAQDWSFDARAIGMGSVGTNGNIGSKMIADERDYHAIVLPIGLFQVLRDLDIFKPSSPQFDPIRATEYAASPLHYVINRDDGDTGMRLVSDIRNARVSRDLNDYRGFVPVTQPTAQGLAMPSFGGTFTVSRGDRGAFHGIYVGAGPYLTTRADFVADQALTNLLASPTPVYLPNATLRMNGTARGEAAIAITGGYRARFALSPDIASSDRDGIYVAVNYDYLRGLRYENGGASVRFDTDRTGLLTVNPLAPSQVASFRDTSTSGHGFAIDVGTGIVLGPWEFGFGANGLWNRIDWSSVEQTTWALSNGLTGGAFVKTGPRPLADVRVELPVDYRGNVGYRAERWSLLTEFGRGLQGGTFHGGAEYRLPGVAFRGGALYSREEWEPTSGVGVSLSPRVALDAALYGTAANVQRTRHAAIGLSLRVATGPR